MMRREMSSVWLILPLLNSLRGMFFSSSEAEISSRLLTLATVAMAKRPRWDFIRSGCASVSLMTPIPEAPLNFGSSDSNFVLKYDDSRLWILRKNPSDVLNVAIPARRVPRCE